MAARGRSTGGHKRKSLRQVRFLLSKGSPLTLRQRSKLKGELRRGSVKIIKKRKKIS
jgi:hypothetical protein